MRYDFEYNSYKFSDQEVSNIIDALNFFSTYSPLDKERKQKVVNLRDNIVQTNSSGVPQ